jgi:hypothetical protein
MNRAVHSSSAEKRRVCGVHNRVNFKLGNVAAGDPNLASRGLHESLSLQ